eukprot:s696_g20.t1
MKATPLTCWQEDACSSPLKSRGACLGPTSKENHDASKGLPDFGKVQPPNTTLPSSHFASVRKSSPLWISRIAQKIFLRPILTLALTKTQTMATSSGWWIPAGNLRWAAANVMGEVKWSSFILNPVLLAGFRSKLKLVVEKNVPWRAQRRFLDWQ